MTPTSASTFVLFDVDGTLVYTEGSDSRCFARAYETIYGKPFPSLDWRVYPHVTDHTIFTAVIEQHFGRAIVPEEVAIFQEHYLQLLQENRTKIPDQHCIVPGAAEMIAHLAGTADYEVGFATGGWAAPAHLKLNYVGIPTADKVLVGVDNKVRREDILHAAITEVNGRLAVPAKRVVYVGDAIWDVRTTRNMGIDLVGIRYKGDGEVLKKEGVQTVIQDYRDLDAFLVGIEEAKPPG